MKATLLSADLMFVSKMAGAAQRTGAHVTTDTTVDGLVERVERDGVSLVLVDLALPGIVPETLVRRVREAQTQIKIVAFGPHVHTGKLAAARAAGCDVVLSRGEFDARLDDVLRGEVS